MLLHSPDPLGLTLPIAKVLLAVLSEVSVAAMDSLSGVLALGSSLLPRSDYRLIASFVGLWELLSTSTYCVLYTRECRTQ